MEKRQNEHPEVKELLELLKRKCEPDYLYRQLAEECVELAQAALKMIRAENGEMPLESTVNVKSNFLEELADVTVMWNLAYGALNGGDRDKADAIAEMKLRRMKERMERMPDREKAEKTEGEEDRICAKIYVCEGERVSARAVRKIITELMERMFED